MIIRRVLFVPDPPTPAAGGGTPVTPPASLTQEVVKGMIAEAISPLTKLAEQVPGMSQRHAEDAAKAAVEALQKTKAEAPPITPPADAALLEMKENLSKLDKELAETRKTTLKKEKALLVSQHMPAKVLKSARPLVAAKLEEMIEQDDKGNFFMTVSEKLETIGETVTKQVSVEEGIKHYFAEHNDIVEAEVRGGAGAGGGNAAQFETVTYEELLENPRLMTEFYKTKGKAELDRLEKVYLQKKRDAKLVRTGK